MHRGNLSSKTTHNPSSFVALFGVPVAFYTISVLPARWPLITIGAILLVVTGVGSTLVVLYAPDRCVHVVVLTARLIAFVVNAAMGSFSLLIAFIGFHGLTDTSQQYNDGLVITGLLISVPVIFNCVALVVSDQRLCLGVSIPAILLSLSFFLVAIGELLWGGPAIENHGTIFPITAFYTLAFFSANAFSMRLAHRRRFFMQ